MSTLSMRLKQRARMLAAGVALSAATLALIPGVAEATDPTGCVCRLVGDITDTGNPSPGPSDGSQETSDGPDNSAKLVGLQDTSVLNGSEIGNDNVSGNSTGISAPVLSDDSGSQFDNDASSTSNGNSGSANSPSGDKQNDADVALGQDTEVANDSRTGNNNASGNSTGVSAPVLSDDSGSQFNNDASSTDNGGTDNGGTDNGGTDNGGTNDSGKKPNSGQGNGDEAGDPGNSQPNNNGGDDGSPNGGQSDKR